MCDIEKKRGTLRSNNLNLKVKFPKLPKYVLSEKDFYPPEDNRVLCSGIDDVSGGDNFGDYARYYFNRFADELFDDD